MQSEALARADLSVVLKIIVGVVLATSGAMSLAQVAPSGATGAEKQPELGQKGPAAANRHPTCLGCHGIPGYRTAFPEVYPVPLIAGQQPAYLVAALKAYASGERSHPSMRGIAAGLSDEAAKDLAQHYGAAVRAGDAQPSVRAAAQGRRASEAGKAKAAQLCAACHGADGNKPSDPSIPILAGQYHDYLVRAIGDYKIGRRGNPVMKGFAAQLSREDTENLAAWFSNQPSNLHLLPR